MYVRHCKEKKNFFLPLTLNNSIIGSVKHTFHILLNDDQ